MNERAYIPFFCISYRPMADFQSACASWPLARQPKPWPGQGSRLREEFHLGMDFLSQSIPLRRGVGKHGERST